jgi:hypothetical protein
MKKKVRKFASGGDIITGLGAVLVGKALYDKYKEGKGESKDDDYTRRVKEFGRKGDFPEAKKEEKAAPESNVAADKDEVRDAARERALKQSKDPKSNLVPEGADKSALYESDKALVRTDGKGTKPAVNKPKPRFTPKQGVSTNTGVDAGIAAGDKNKDAVKTVVNSLKDRNAMTLEKGTGTKTEAKTKPSKYTTPGDPSKKEATSKAGIVFGGSTVRSDKDKMAERAREVQRRREEEMKSRYKKGGAVKKYASGGSVSSASKRADGIAIRGKTRA